MLFTCKKHQHLTLYLDPLKFINFQFGRYSTDDAKMIDAIKSNDYFKTGIITVESNSTITTDIIESNSTISADTSISSTKSK